MLAMTIIVGILLGGFTVVVTVDYVKNIIRPIHVVQLMMPIITYVAAIATMIMSVMGIIQINGQFTVVILVALIIFVVSYCDIMNEDYRHYNGMSTLSIIMNLVALVATLFIVSTWC